MADKIVQLVDKNGDNIFPVATVANGATITMTDVDPGEGSALGDNEYVAVYGGAPIIMDYSTSEVDTGARWIDGSAIYKKTINLGALPNSTSKDVAHNISNLGFVVDIQATASNGTYRIIIPATATSDASHQIALNVTGTDVNIVAGDDRSAYSGYVTLYYTKSS